MRFVIKHRAILIATLIGAIGGYVYYYYVGCVSGSCPITSKPFNSTLYGAMMGGLFGSTLTKAK